MYLNARDAYFTRVLPDGRVLDAFPLTFGRARVTISASLQAVNYQNGW